MSAGFVGKNPYPVPTWGLLSGAMKMMNKVTRCLVPAVLAVALIGCKGKEKAQETPPTPTREPAKKEAPPQSITIYSGRTEALVAPVIAEFEKSTGIKANVKYAATGQLAATLLEEGARSPADVFLAQDASTLGLLEAKKVFMPLPEAIIGRVGESFKSPTGQWVGVSGRARVLVYNTQKLKPEELPATAAELTDPKWKGRVGWAPENASFQSALSTMVQLEGEEAATQWVKGMQANQPHAYPKNSPAVVAVSRGEVDVALVNHYYLYRLRAELGGDFPVENHYFRSGKADSLVNVSGAAILATSKNKKAAETFVNYLLSDSAQTFFTEKNYEFPLVSGVETPLGLPDIASLKAPKVDLAKIQDLAAVHKILRDAGVLP
jgi:iron(III) transport system substrate-binding protein